MHAQATQPADDLFERCRAGEKQAQRELFDLYVDRVRRMLARLIGNHPDLDDLTQTVFIGCFRSLHTFRGDALFSTWLSTICVRVAQRHMGRRTRAPVLVELGTVDHGHDDVQRSLEHRDRLRRFAAVLDEMPVKLRVAYVLHAIEGYTLKETAAIIGRSKGLVTLRVRAANREIERKMKDESRPTAGLGPSTGVGP